MASYNALTVLLSLNKLTNIIEDHEKTKLTGYKTTVFFEALLLYSGVTCKSFFNAK